MRRTSAALAVALLLGVAGCGSDPVQGYCTAVESHRKEFAAMVSSDAGGAALLEHLAMLRELADKAPRDLADEWQTFLNAVENLDKAIKAAHVSAQDFKGGKPPAGTSAQDVQAIRSAADQLGEADVTQAVGAIEQQARDVCKVNFGL